MGDLRTLMVEQLILDTERTDLYDLYTYLMYQADRELLFFVIELATPSEDLPGGQDPFTEVQMSNLLRAFITIVNTEATDRTSSRSGSTNTHNTGFWDDVPMPFEEPDSILNMYLNFFESFCSTINNASDDDVALFRTTLLRCADILDLTPSDRVILRRRGDAGGLCDWMRRKQRERVHDIEPGTNDVLTITHCEEIPLLFLIVIEQSCFEIISLWTYLQNDRSPANQNPVNPATQRPFTNEQLEAIRQRYMATFLILETFRDIIRNNT